jgi:hypothetical protein
MCLQKSAVTFLVASLEADQAPFYLSCHHIIPSAIYFSNKCHSMMSEEKQRISLSKTHTYEFDGGLWYPVVAASMQR